MIKKYSAAIILSFLALFNFSCAIFTSEVETQDDRGFPIQKMEMDKTSVFLEGTKGSSTAELNVTYYPSFADDTEIFWSTSDSSVASISDSNSVSCTVTLQGDGNCVITARNYSGKVFASCAVSGSLEKNAPFEAENFLLNPYSNNIEASWTNPEFNADDLYSAVFEVYEKDSGSLAGTSTFLNCTQKAASYSVRLGGGFADSVNCTYTLKPECEYSVKLFICDLNGNKSTESEGSAKTLEEESTAPQSVSSALLTDFSGNSASLSWTDPSDDDLQFILIKSFSADSETKVADDVIVKKGVQSATVLNLLDESEYNFYLYAYDNNFNVSEAACVNYKNGPHVTNVSSSVPSDYSGIITLTWTDPEEEFSKIKISASCSGLSTVQTEVLKGEEECTISGLIPGNEYDFSFSTLDSENQIIGSKIYSASPSKVLIRFYSINNSGFMVVTSAKAFKTQSTSSAAYHYKWLKMPALDGTSTFAYTGDSSTGTQETYSIMAMDLSGKGSGLYAYLTEASSSVTSSTGASAELSLADEESIKTLGKESFASFFTANTTSSSYKSLRFTENYYQLGGNGSSAVIYRTSSGAPGYTQWHWTITQEAAN